LLRPLDDRIVVKRDPEIEKIGSIIIPDTHRKKTLKGVVVAVGPGALKNGKRIPMDTKVDDKVIFSEHAGLDLGNDYSLMKEEGVLGVLYDN
jgi:chaperonin GroES